jgi:hypothetical protein
MTATTLLQRLVPEFVFDARLDGNGQVWRRRR